MFKVKGLHRRWLVNTVGVVLALGLVCVLGITAVFAACAYSSMEADLRNTVENARNFTAEIQEEDKNKFQQLCVDYITESTITDQYLIQFVDIQGRVLAQSNGQTGTQSITTPEVFEASGTRGVHAYVGMDGSSDRRVMAISGPVIFRNGEVIGIFRISTPTQEIDAQIFFVAAVALFVLAIVVLIFNHRFLRSVVDSLDEIADKAGRITAGSYGTQIQNRYEDELGELADAINDMSRKISENEKVQTDFISSLSHELRTPLTAIAGWSETILNGEELNDSTKRGVKIIQRETKRLTEMVVELLDFTRIQDGRMTLNMETADIRSEFEDTVFMYGSRLEQDGITLEYTDTEDDIPEISCDPKRLRQVFLNILDNAAKHGGEGRRIEASIHYQNSFVIVCIRDYGPGIPEDEIPLVKKKFYKGSSKARGSGIGLAVCDEIIQLHAGTLELCNAEGGGTLVTIAIPASQ